MIKQFQKGTTIIEIILYVSLLSIFLLIILNIFIGALNLQMESRSLSAVQTDGRFILSRLMYDLKNADSIITPATLGSNSQILVFVSNSITYVYSLNQGVLSLTTGGVTQALNGLETNITMINFKRIGNIGGKPTIQINFTIQSKNIKQNEQVESRDYQITGGLR